ncbi:MAG TPA: ferrous iron transport protein A [Firmicutes bacterium]|jgi:ferrous iron transport protein A|nr:ferrous iron transport protein A [Bacillota bacterium]
MSNNELSLNLLPINQVGKVRYITANSTIRSRLLDLGLISNTTVKALQRSPAGDPTAYQIRGTVIALRSEDAAHIIIDPIN